MTRCLESACPDLPIFWHKRLHNFDIIITKQGKWRKFWLISKKAKTFHFTVEWKLFLQNVIFGSNFNTRVTTVSTLICKNPNKIVKPSRFIHFTKIFGQKQSRKIYVRKIANLAISSSPSLTHLVALP